MITKKIAPLLLCIALNSYAVQNIPFSPTAPNLKNEKFMKVFLLHGVKTEIGKTKHEQKTKISKPAVHTCPSNLEEPCKGCDNDNAPEEEIITTIEEKSVILEDICTKSSFTPLMVRIEKDGSLNNLGHFQYDQGRSLDLDAITLIAQKKATYCNIEDKDTFDVLVFGDTQPTKEQCYDMLDQLRNFNLNEQNEQLKMILMENSPEAQAAAIEALNNKYAQENKATKQAWAPYLWNLSGYFASSVVGGTIVAVINRLSPENMSAESLTKLAKLVASSVKE